MQFSSIYANSDAEVFRYKGDEIKSIYGCIMCFQQIPKNILLEVLGPSKVFNEVIKKIINSIVVEYVEKVYFPYAKSSIS